MLHIYLGKQHFTMQIQIIKDCYHVDIESVFSESECGCFGLRKTKLVELKTPCLNHVKGLFNRK